MEEEKIAKREQERIAKAEALKLKREQTKRDKELASQARAQAKVAAAKAKAADDAQVEDGGRRKRRRKGGEADDAEGRRRRVPGLQQLTESDPAVLRNLAKLPAVHAAPVQTNVDAFALSALCGRPVIARLKKGAVKKLMSACPNRLTKEAVNEDCRFLNKAGGLKLEFVDLLGVGWSFNQLNYFDQQVMLLDDLPSKTLPPPEQLWLP